MKWHTVRLADVAPTPWKNGGGTTRELLAWPSATDWQIRLSVAEVAASGPFSSFAQTERWFAVLSGAGVRLDVGGTVTEQRCDSAPFCFDGAVPTTCSLIDGPTTDFNLMLRGYKGAMRCVSGPFAQELITPTFVAVYAMNTRTELVFGAEKWILEPQTLLWGTAEPDDADDVGLSLQINTEGALWMEARP